MFSLKGSEVFLQLLVAALRFQQLLIPGHTAVAFVNAGGMNTLYMYTHLWGDRRCNKDTVAASLLKFW